MDGYITSAENTEGSGRWCDVTGSQSALGCPTGHSTRALLFLTYINDITNDIMGQIRLFADDALLYHPIKTEADGCVLQGDLNSLHRWSKRWKMAFNTTKCHVLHITRNRRVIRH